MNLPNKLTVSRLILVIVFALFAFPLPEIVERINLPGTNFLSETKAIIALVIYVIASATDALDGHIARKNNLVTNFGKFWDPIADKLLVTAALLSLVDVSTLYVWAALIILSREFIVSGVRMMAASEGVVIAAGKMGKLKMIFQTISLIVLLAARIFETSWIKFVYLGGNILLVFAVILTIISGIEYVAKNKGLFTKDM